jgi:hypothetical protein
MSRAILFVLPSLWEGNNINNINDELTEEEIIWADVMINFTNDRERREIYRKLGKHKGLWIFNQKDLCRARKFDKENGSK